MRKETKVPSLSVPRQPRREVEKDQEMVKKRESGSKRDRETERDREIETMGQ